MDASIEIPIILSLCIPILLFLSQILALSPGVRFKLVAGTTLTLWTVICLIALNGPALFITWRWCAGFLYLSSVLILTFMFWSVLCFGYTLSMLISLSKCNSTKNWQQWSEEHAGKEGISHLTKNRATVLIGLGCAYVDKDNLVLTHRGMILSRLVMFLNFIFGIKQC